MKRISEKNYLSEMEEIVEPYLNLRKSRGNFARIEGQNIRYEHIEGDSNRVLVMVHGFTEELSKLYETAYYFSNMGYDVWLLQQRGHGLSYRVVEDTSLVYIENYRDLIEDLHTFVNDVVFKNRKDVQEKVLFGHSMGGGVSAAYLETYPDDFDKAILSSPMLEMDSGSIPVWVASAAARLMILFGKGKNYMPGTTPFKMTMEFDDTNTDCRARYDWYHGRCLEDDSMQMSAPSVQTALEFLRLTRYATKPANMAKVKAKVLLVQAEKDRMVKPGGQNRFVENTVDTTKITIDAPHEIYRCSDSIVEEYWSHIEEFLGK